MTNTLLAFSIDFGKEVYDSFNRILGIVGIVMLVVLALGIIAGIIKFATNVTRFSNELKTAKKLRAERKAKKK